MQRPKQYKDYDCTTAKSLPSTSKDCPGRKSGRARKPVQIDDVSITKSIEDAEFSVELAQILTMKEYQI